MSNYENLKEKKQKDIEIHEKSLKIGYELSNSMICCKLILYKSCFVDDLLDFFNNITNWELINGVKKDYVEYIQIIRRLKSDNLVQIFSNIMEISIIVIINLINSNGDESRIHFLEKV